MLLFKHVYFSALSAEKKIFFSESSLFVFLTRLGFWRRPHCLSSTTAQILCEPPPPPNFSFFCLNQYFLGFLAADVTWLVAWHPWYGTRWHDRGCYHLAPWTQCCWLCPVFTVEKRRVLIWLCTSAVMAPSGGPPNRESLSARARLFVCFQTYWSPAEEKTLAIAPAQAGGG